MAEFKKLHIFGSEVTEGAKKVANPSCCQKKPFKWKADIQNDYILATFEKGETSRNSTYSPSKLVDIDALQG